MIKQTNLNKTLDALSVEFVRKTLEFLEQRLREIEMYVCSYVFNRNKV